jgi:hypothetical protein
VVVTASSSRAPLIPEYRDARRKMPAQRHGELLAAAVKVSAEEGLAAVTLRKVAAVREAQGDRDVVRHLELKMVAE